MFPFFGPAVYLFFGERRLGARRLNRISARQVVYEELIRKGEQLGLTNIDWDKYGPDEKGLDQLGRNLVGFPTVKGSDGALIDSTLEILGRLAADIRNAEKCVLMEFYIWNAGGKADEVLEALIDAAQRGVNCRLLVDAIGGGAWWKTDQPKRLKDAGVKLNQALPVSFFRSLIDRTDLRLHRKIVVIDCKLAWTGSMNLVDPRCFKQESNVGEWVDAMSRLEGSVIGPLALTVIGDWAVETGEDIETVIREMGLNSLSPVGEADVQVVPSGPGETEDGLLQMLLGVIYSAKEELILTTPYFVPDESMFRALRSAAARGVCVNLIVPAKLDSFMTHHASRSFYDGLLEVGVKIHLYADGLLHTKAITADRRLSMFGTVNLDMRSIWLNYEVALFIYGERYSRELHTLQEGYIRQSRKLDADEWFRRPRTQQFLENGFRLLSPLL